MLVLGAFTGLFAVPLQVFMQARPPKDKKGRMIAVMNQANWIGIIIAAGLYWRAGQADRSRRTGRAASMFLFIAAADAADRAVLSSEETKTLPHDA